MENDKKEAALSNKPSLLRAYRSIGYFFYHLLRSKTLKYWVWKLTRIHKISKSAGFNLLRYFMDASYKKSFTTKKPTDFPNYLSAVVMVKNEALYIEEWLEYHLLMGFQKFYIYDNESSDNLIDILQPYIKSGIVEYKYFPWRDKQLVAYNDILQKAQEETYWLAVIDIDEFIVPIKCETITDFLKDFEQYAGVEINWLMYGSSGEKHWRDGLVIERFKRHGKIGEHFYGSGTIKTICNPRAVFKMDVHTPFYFRFAKTVNPDKKIRKYNYKDVGPVYDKIRINHYFTKSYDECLLKLSRGWADKRNSSFFEYGDINDEYDDLMDKYIPLVSENIRKRRGQRN